MSIFLGWQLRMDDPKQSVSDALERYYKRFGYPPQILLVSDKLEEASLPDGMNLVVKVQRVPKNILMLGEVVDEH